MSYDPHSTGGYGPYEGPPPSGPPPGGYGPYGAPPPPGGPPKNYLVHNILGIFGCTVVGIIGLIFALQVSSKWQIGDYAGAESAAQTAKILGIIGMVSFILMIAFFVLYFGFIFVMIMIGMSASAM